MNELTVDPMRLADFDESTSTGVYVRASFNGKWGSYDINTLTLDSLRVWLRSRGGQNEWAENVVCMLLGHPMEPTANT